eukprot:Phypoly_transcript_10249.p1 GENE.Phypoly_transcript_10249~~Phypoly_transcript_10249.p1  ORF type:complete len:357 (-),score=62.97 Phypoly_transcript_10249:42-1112(-)
MINDHYLLVDPSTKLPPIIHTHSHTHEHGHIHTHAHGHEHEHNHALPPPKSIQTAPNKATGKENASLFFVGTATTILEWEGMRMMTDPNFLHAGDHVHLGPGVTGTRLTNPAINIEDLPPIDFILLSHYHADHFDQKVEAMLRKDLPIISTPHAKENLVVPEKGFTNVRAVDVWNQTNVDVKTNSKRQPRIRITGMPGKHVAGTFTEAINNIAHAVPPTNGWMLELGYTIAGGDTEEAKANFKIGYTIYISGDTLFVSDLEDIPKRYPHVDLMLIHLGGTTIPGPHVPLLMVTMDAKQGIQLVQLIHPELTIPIHFDDYDVFLSKLGDFKEEMQKLGLQEKVVYLDRGDQFLFEVK